MLRRINARLERVRASRDTGAGTLEYLGIVVLAAILVAAIVLAVSNAQVGERAKQALCELTSLGQGDCGSAGVVEVRAPEDYVPGEECVVGADGEGAEVSAGALITGGVGGDWLVEQLGDGTYRLTRSANATGGVGVGVGFDVSVDADEHAYGAGAQASAEAEIVIGGGEVFVADSLEEAQAILAARTTENVKTAVVGNGVTRWLVDGVHDVFGGDIEAEHAVPDETFVEAGQNIEGSAGLTATVVNAEAEGSVSQMLGVSTRADGTSTGYFTSEAELTGSVESLSPGAVEGSVVFGEMSGTLAGKVILEVDYDEDGNATAVRARTSYVVDGTLDEAYNSASSIDDPNVVHEVTAELPLDTDADRATALRMLQASGVPYVPGLSDGFDAGEYASNRIGMMDATSDFFKATSASGQVWRQTSTEDTTSNGFSFDAAWVAKVGLSAEATSTRQVLTGYDYWNGESFTARAGCGSGVG